MEFDSVERKWGDHTLIWLGDTLIDGGFRASEAWLRCFMSSSREISRRQGLPAIYWSAQVNWIVGSQRFLPRKNYDIFNNLQLSMIVGAAECRARASRNGLFAGSSLGLDISSISINVSSPAPCKRAFCSLADKKAFIKLSEYCCVLTRLHTLLVPPPEKKTVQEAKARKGKEVKLPFALIESLAFVDVEKLHLGGFFFRDASRKAIQHYCARSAREKSHRKYKFNLNITYINARFGRVRLTMGPCDEQLNKSRN